MVGFLGANGAGKTTSLKIIMDFIRADSGDVCFDPSLGKNKIEVFKHIGFLPERPYFYPNLTGNEFLNFMGSLSELSKKQIHAGIQRWASIFKIDHALERPLKTYSKGMLQRVGFLATILHEPKFIILDEPLSGLDPIGRKELKDVIIQVHAAGKTVFFSSHIVSDIEEICDRVIFLKEGKLIYDGDVAQLIKTDDESSYVVKFHAPDIKLNTNVINIQQLPNQLVSVKVMASNKQSLLAELFSKSIDIHAVEIIRPSLEEIFYKTKRDY